MQPAFALETLRRAGPKLVDENVERRPEHAETECSRILGDRRVVRCRVVFIVSFVSFVVFVIFVFFVVLFC
jgi:hypothetical protein